MMGGPVPELARARGLGGRPRAGRPPHAGPALGSAQELFDAVHALVAQERSIQLAFHE
jgi:hypothetical protein